MVHSADSRIQGHAFRCSLFSPAVSDHASTNLPHPSALGRDPKRNGARRPRCSQTTERPAGRARQSTVCLGKSEDRTRKLCPHCEPGRQGYSGQVATNCSWMRAPLVEHASGDQNRKSALVSGAVVETVCTLCHIRLSAYHRALQVGWSRCRAVLMLTAF